MKDIRLLQYDEVFQLHDETLLLRNILCIHAVMLGVPIMAYRKLTFTPFMLYVTLSCFPNLFEQGYLPVHRPPMRGEWILDKESGTVICGTTAAEADVQLANDWLYSFSAPGICHSEKMTYKPRHEGQREQRIDRLRLCQHDLYVRLLNLYNTPPDESYYDDLYPILTAPRPQHKMISPPGKTGESFHPMIPKWDKGGYGINWEELPYPSKMKKKLGEFRYWEWQILRFNHNTELPEYKHKELDVISRMDIEALKKHQLSLRKGVDTHGIPYPEDPPVRAPRRQNTITFPASYIPAYVKFTFEFDQYLQTETKSANLQDDSHTETGKTFKGMSIHSDDDTFSNSEIDMLPERLDGFWIHEVNFQKENITWEHIEHLINMGWIEDPFYFYSESFQRPILTGKIPRFTPMPFVEWETAEDRGTHVYPYTRGQYGISSTLKSIKKEGRVINGRILTIVMKLSTI